MTAEAPAYNAGNERHVKHRKRREQRERERIVEAQLFVLSDPRGRNFVWWLLGETGVFKNPFTGTAATDFNCGRSDVGRKLMAVLEDADPEHYLEMWSEHLKLNAEAKKIEQAALTQGAAEKDEGGSDG